MPVAPRPLPGPSRYGRLAADAVEWRLGTLEARMDRVEQRLGALETRVTEGFIGVDERFRSLGMRLEYFEERMVTALDHVREEVNFLARRVGTLEGHVKRLDERVEKLEAGLVDLNVRVDGFADDMRQRFRQVNERLAGAA